MRKRALSTLETLSPKKRKLDQGTNTESLQNDEIIELRKKVEDLEKITADLRRREAALRKLKTPRYVISIKRRSSSPKLHMGALRREMVKVLSTCFTEGQIRCLLGGKKRVKWSSEDIANALTLRSLSKKAYEYLRKRNIPLPCRSTLQKWIRQFKCRPGILGEVLCLLKARASNYKDSEKIAVLSFDEMNIDGRISYDSSDDRILGPHSNVQVAMVRGLFAKWKQPIYYDFDVTMTSELLQNIISQLESCGIRIVAVTCDMGGKNSKVWKELHVNTNKSFFSNPVDSNRNVWVFCDVPHLLKLLRNHFLDEGFVLGDGSKFQKKTIEDLLETQKGDLSITHHINEAHLSVTGRSRQNVRMAAQLFSRRTAVAVRYALNKEDESHIIELVNDTYDVLNSRAPDEKNAPLRSGYGLKLKSQENTLRRFLKFISEVRVGQRKSLLPFQKGFIISINSLFGLFEDMKKENLCYILTARLNQDCLENIFSRVRGLGAFYNNPSPFEFRNRIRLLLLAGSNEIPLSSGVCVQADCDPSTSEKSAENEDDLMSFVTSELCVDVVEGSTSSEKIDDPEETSELLAMEDLSHDAESEDVNHDAIKYIAGYLANKCRSIDKSLGVRGEKCTFSQEVTQDWIAIISKGGLTRPTEDWTQKVMQFEVLFGNFHGLDISKCERVIQTLTSVIKSKFSEIDEKIISLYVRTRTFIRIRHLNKRRKIQAMEKYSLKKRRMWVASASLKTS